MSSLTRFECDSWLIGKEHNVTMSDAPDQIRGFKINDRRTFTPEGELRSEIRSEDRLSPSVDGASASEVEPPPPAPPLHEPQRGASPRSPFGPPQQMRFLDLLSLLAAQASLALGEGPVAPEGREEDLRGAQMMISLIEVLNEKTKGNLSDEEQRALDQVLYELRMAFMVKAKVIKT